VSASESLAAPEMGSRQEKRFLLPLIREKMRQEFGKPGYNATLASNLSQRYQNLAGASDNA
jgi:hypothetical protein